MNSTNVYVLYLYQNAFDWFKTVTPRRSRWSCSS
jgi:hypothetical protein